MLWDDLRGFLDELERDGALTKINGADWNVELGAITEIMCERGGPGLLFDEIPGYPKGFRVAAHISKTNRHVATIFGMTRDAPPDQLAREWDDIEQMMEPVPPREVPTGPVMENVLTGSDIDLLKFPVPQWHEDDGNRYIGTGVCVIQRDTDSGYVNVGCQRVAVQDATTCGLFQEPDSHGDIIRRKYWAQGQKCPVLITVGQEPILTILSGAAMYKTPWGISEFDMAGYLQGEPVSVVKGPITGLPMPASAEIAIEGYILPPDERLEPEGPFGEWTGYYGHGRRPETVVEVAAIYHRNDPIIFGDPPVRPIRAEKEVRFYTFGMQKKARLERQGVKGVKAVFQIARPNFSVISIEQQYEGHVEDVMRALEPGGDEGHSGNHMWIIVDEDIDPTNVKEVLWAMASRCIPEHGITVLPATAQWQLDPRIPPAERSDPSQHGRERYSAHNLMINACKPYGWKDAFPMVNRNSPELTADIEKKWANLFVGLPRL